MPPEPPEDVIEVIVAAEQIVCKAVDVVTTLAAGFTITVDVIAEPVQPFAVGVMVNVTVTADKVVFVSLPVISPVPLDAIPVTEEVLFLVQV